MHNCEKLRRSLLFVPGDRPERFDKAVGSGADMVCLDLEDGVLRANKTAAREHVLDYLARNRPACELVVRVNSLRTTIGLEDLLALAAAETRPEMLVLPKVESAAEIAIARGVLAEKGPTPQIVALVESLAGLERVREISSADGVALVGLGTGDLAAEMGVGMDWEPMAWARMSLAYAAKAARVAALDGAWLALDDLAGLGDETRRSAALGYTAKVCLHPKQVAEVHAAFQPSEAEIERARGIVAAFEGAAVGAISHQGQMIDLPIFEAARRKLAIWHRERR